MKKIIVLFSIYLLYTGVLFSQDPQPSFFLNEPIDPDETHEYIARDFIEMAEGFEASPNPYSHVLAEIDPYLVFPPETGTTGGPPNNNNGGIVGTIEGSFTVTPNGTASYRIPIQVPGGTNGMSPGLSLNYSSQGADGIIGEGWKLGGLSVISRYPYTLYYNDNSQSVVFSNADEFLLDGQHLTKIGDNEYRTESESFKKVVPIEGDVNNGFIVYHSNGSIYRYGSSENSRQKLQSSPQPITWYIDAIFDVSNNYITFEYYNNTDYGFICPSIIRYTGNSNTGVSPYYRIEFIYEDNFNTPKMYFYNEPFVGVFSQVIKRLTNIKCRYIPSWEIINEYELNYDNFGLFDKKYFNSITQYDSDGKYFNPTFFQWNINNYTPIQYTHKPLTENVEETITLLSSDFNQDGKDDLIHFNTDPNNDKENFYIHMNTGYGIFSEEAEFFHEFYYPVLSFQTGDFNGDAISDIFYAYQFGNNVRGKIMYMNYDENTNTFNPNTTSDLFDVSLSIYNNPKFIINDFTGDGIMDCGVLYQYSGSLMELHFYLSTINNPLSVLVTSGTNIWSYPNEFFSKDFDGDRKAEILVIADEGSKVFDLSLNNQIINRYNAHDDFANNNGKIVTGDFNKDGKADVLLINNDNENNVRFYHSYGNGFIAAPHQTIDNIIAGVNRVQAIDLNGDRMADLSIVKILWGSGSDPDQFIRVDYLTNPDGQSFLPGEILILQEPLSGTNLNHLKYTWCEVYNSGMIDMVTTDINSTKSSTYRTFCTFDNSFSPISEIKNGFGEVIKVYYCQNDYFSGYSKGEDEEFPVFSINSGLPVVTAYEMETGSGSSSYLVQLNYKGAKYHRFGKGFLGFDEFTIINNSNGKTTTTYFSHDNPYYNVHKDCIKQWHTESSTLIKREIYSNFYHDYGEKRFLKYVSNTTTETFNLSSQLTDYYYEDFQYGLDANGIPISIFKNSKKEFGAEWVNKYQEISLLNLTTGSKWILGLQETIKTKHTSYDDDLIERLTVKEYDNQTGQLRKIVLEPSDPNTNETIYEYDVYGNVIETKLSATGLTDRINTYVYSQDGRLLDNSFNAVGHKTEYQYYNNTGNIKKTIDANGLETTLYYDGFGRNNKTIAPDARESHIVLRWANDHPDAPANAIYYSWSQTSGQPETIVFFDKLSRELRKVTNAFDGRKIYTDQEYYSSGNKIGLLEKISNPYFIDEMPYYKTFTYDDLRRKDIITAPDGVTTTYSYDIKQVTTTVIEGTETRVKRNKLDAAGRLKYSMDVTNNETVNNTYYSNGLLKETWVDGHDDTKIQYFYDIFGNMDILIDPNRGSITKTHNAFWEIVTEEDANSFVTEYEYDQLGRITMRKEDDGITNWYYDTQDHGIGKLHYVTYEFTDANDNTTNSREEYFYDELCRIIKIEQTIDEETLAQNNTYDVYGRIKTVKYPSEYVFMNYYNENGYLWKVAGNNPEVVWEADVVNSVGKIQEFSLGHNIHSTRTYQPDNFRILSIQSGKTTPNDLQNLGYGWEDMGNLDYRRDNNKNLYESFTYDDFDRLTHCTVNSNLQLHQSYTDVGNIYSKSDVGIYQYGEDGAGPNAVSKITEPVSPLLNADQQIDYTTFDKIVKIVQENKVLNMAYGYGHNRIRQVIDQGDGNITSKTYFGSNYEKIENNDGTSKEIHYLASPGGIFGIMTIDHQGNKAINYVLKDHLGSINLVLDHEGTIVEEVNFDAWGRLRDPDTWSYDGAPVSTLFDIGYTMHEHLYDFDLINMNGRLYDPVIARFLSPDPFLQEPENTQNHNRYSYCLNNPLKYTDPSGYNFIDGLESFVIGFIDLLTIPGRLFSGANEWLNDQINGTPDPNGYFNLEYIAFGILPAPPPGYICLFESYNGVSYGSNGGFTSADGTFYSHDEMAAEAWALHESNREAIEEGDFINFEVWEEYDRYQWIETPGMSIQKPQQDELTFPDAVDPTDKGAYKQFIKWAIFIRKHGIRDISIARVIAFEKLYKNRKPYGGRYWGTWKGENGVIKWSTQGLTPIKYRRNVSGVWFAEETAGDRTRYTILIEGYPLYGNSPNVSFFEVIYTSYKDFRNDYEKIFLEYVDDE
jgi:RHS repeat-associated protein